jgi:hypothetical protein
MATSSSFSVDYEIAEFVDEAFERIYVSPESLTARHARSARRSLDLLLKQWSVDVPHLWKIVQQQFVPSLGESEVVLDVGSHAVLEAVIRDSSGNDTPFYPISRSEWMEITDKDQQGRPDRYWVEMLKDERRVHFWQAQNSDAYTLIFNVSMYMHDVGAPTNTVDLPPQWFEALASGLAVRLCQKFAPLDRREKLMRELVPLHDAAYFTAKGAGHEHSEVRFEMG